MARTCSPWLPFKKDKLTPLLNRFPVQHNYVQHQNNNLQLKLQFYPLQGYCEYNLLFPLWTYAVKQVRQSLLHFLCMSVKGKARTASHRHRVFLWFCRNNNKQIYKKVYDAYEIKSLKEIQKSLCHNLEVSIPYDKWTSLKLPRGEAYQIICFSCNNPLVLMSNHLETLICYRIF